MILVEVKYKYIIILYIWNHYILDYLYILVENYQEKLLFNATYIKYIIKKQL